MKPLRHPLRGRPLLLLLIAASVVACDDDEPVTEITTEQAEVLTVAVWEQAYRVGVGVPIGFGNVDAPPLAAQTTDYEDETTVSCDLSGSVTVETSAFFQQEGEGGTVSIVGVKTHSGCTFQTEGFTFTLDGAPAVTTAWDFTGDGQGAVSFDGSMTGAVNVTSDQGSGLCAFDVEWGGSNTAEGTFGFQLTGTVCGRSVSRSLTVNTAT